MLKAFPSAKKKLQNLSGKFDPFVVSLLKAFLVTFSSFCSNRTDEAFSSDDILGVVCVSIEGKLENYAPVEIDDVQATTRRCIANLLKVDVEKIIIRLLYGNSVFIILTLPSEMHAGLLSCGQPALIT